MRRWRKKVSALRNPGWPPTVGTLLQVLVRAEEGAVATTVVVEVEVAAVNVVVAARSLPADAAASAGGTAEDTAQSFAAPVAAQASARRPAHLAKRASPQNQR